MSNWAILKLMYNCVENNDACCAYMCNFINIIPFEMYHQSTLYHNKCVILLFNIKPCITHAKYNLTWMCCQNVFFKITRSKKYYKYNTFQLCHISRVKTHLIRKIYVQLTLLCVFWKLEIWFIFSKHCYPLHQNNTIFCKIWQNNKSLILLVHSLLVKWD